MGLLLSKVQLSLSLLLLLLVKLRRREPFHWSHQHTSQLVLMGDFVRLIYPDPISYKFSSFVIISCEIFRHSDIMLKNIRFKHHNQTLNRICYANKCTENIRLLFQIRLNHIFCHLWSHLPLPLVGCQGGQLLNSHI